MRSNSIFKKAYETDERWLIYDDEEVEVETEVAELVFDQLLEELIVDMGRISGKEIVIPVVHYSDLEGEEEDPFFGEKDREENYPGSGRRNFENLELNSKSGNNMEILDNSDENSAGTGEEIVIDSSLVDKNNFVMESEDFDRMQDY